MKKRKTEKFMNVIDNVFSFFSFKEIGSVEWR